MRGVATRPPHLRGTLLAVLLLAPTLSGCLVARIPALFEEPPPANDPGGGAAPINPASSFRIEPVTWYRNDTWVWEGTDGARITDRVQDVRIVQRVVGGRTLNVTRYDVLSKVEWANDLLPQWSNHTYEPELGITESRSVGQQVRYLRGTEEFRGIPLTWVGTAPFNTTIETIRGGARFNAERAYQIEGQGVRLIKTDRLGDFQAWHVVWNVTVDLDPRYGAIKQITHRWFNATVKNDVRFIQGGVGFELIAYRINNDTRPLQLPAMARSGGGWDVGWTWIYEGPPGVSLVRSVVPCAPLDAPPIHKLCRRQYVHERGVDYFQVRDTITYALGGSPVTTRSITLVPVASGRPHAVAYYETETPTAWRADLNLTGNVPAVVPAPGSYAYKVTGKMFRYLPMDHQVQADQTTAPDSVVTKLGTFHGTRVTGNVTYAPRDPFGDRYNETINRLYSPLVRHDVQFQHNPPGAGRMTFTLIGVHFGAASKPEREL